MLQTMVKTNKTDFNGNSREPTDIKQDTTKGFFSGFTFNKKLKNVQVYYIDSVTMDLLLPRTISGTE